MTEKDEKTQKMVGDSNGEIWRRKSVALRERETNEWSKMKRINGEEPERPVD